MSAALWLLLAGSVAGVGTLALVFTARAETCSRTRAALAARAGLGLGIVSFLLMVSALAVVILS